MFCVCNLLPGLPDKQLTAVAVAAAGKWLLIREKKEEKNRREVILEFSSFIPLYFFLLLNQTNEANRLKAACVTVWPVDRRLTQHCQQTWLTDRQTEQSGPWGEGKQHAQRLQEQPPKKKRCCKVCSVGVNKNIGTQKNWRLIFLISLSLKPTYLLTYLLTFLPCKTPYITLTLAHRN